VPHIITGRRKLCSLYPTKEFLSIARAATAHVTYTTVQSPTRVGAARRADDADCRASITARSTGRSRRAYAGDIGGWMKGGYVSCSRCGASRARSTSSLRAFWRIPQGGWVHIACPLAGCIGGSRERSPIGTTGLQDTIVEQALIGGRNVGRKIIAAGYILSTSLNAWHGTLRACPAYATSWGKSACRSRRHGSSNALRDMAGGLANWQLCGAGEPYTLGSIYWEFGDS